MPALLGGQTVGTDIARPVVRVRCCCCRIVVVVVVVALLLSLLLRCCAELGRVAANTVVRVSKGIGCRTQHLQVSRAMECAYRHPSLSVQGQPDQADPRTDPARRATQSAMVDTLELHGELIKLGGKVVQPVPPGSYMLPVTRGLDFVKSGHYGQDVFCGNTGMVLVPSETDLKEWCDVFLNSDGEDGWTPWTSVKVGWCVGSTCDACQRQDHTYFYKAADNCPSLNLGRHAWDIGTTCTFAQAPPQLKPPCWTCVLSVRLHVS